MIPDELLDALPPSVADLVRALIDVRTLSSGPANKKNNKRINQVAGAALVAFDRTISESEQLTPKDPAALRRYPMLRGDRLPAGSFGTWLVQGVSDGWVSMLSADMTGRLRVSVDRFNWYWDQFQAAAKEME